MNKSAIVHIGLHVFGLEIVTDKRIDLYPLVNESLIFFCQEAQNIIGKEGNAFYFKSQGRIVPMFVSSFHKASVSEKTEKDPVATIKNKNAYLSMMLENEKIKLGEEELRAIGDRIEMYALSHGWQFAIEYS